MSIATHNSVGNAVLPGHTSWQQRHQAVRIATSYTPTRDADVERLRRGHVVNVGDPMVVVGYRHRDGEVLLWVSRPEDDGGDDTTVLSFPRGRSLPLYEGLSAMEAVGDPNTQLSAGRAAARAGVAISTWRSYVARSQAPGPDCHAAADRPRWRLHTVDEWQARRPGTGGRPQKAARSAD